MTGSTPTSRAPDEPAGGPGALDAALEYCGRGWSVVPLHTAPSGRCTCGRPDCPSPAKHPRVRWDRLEHEPAGIEEVRAWWRRWPDANVGVVTGSVSGLAVLDVDPRHGGDAELDRLERRFGALPPTLECHTGGDGRHLYFMCDPDEVPTSPVASGVDLKAEGGLVVAPPSVHASGGRYTWLAGGPAAPPLADLPAWLRDARRRLARRDRGDRGALGVVAPRSAAEQREFARLWGALGVELRPGDRYYTCPLHDDEHPSLHVDAEGCRWYCFGCGRGGSIGVLRRIVRSETELPLGPGGARRRTGGALTRMLRDVAPPPGPGVGAPAVAPSAPRSDPTWMQWPAVQPGGRQEVVGEAGYQEALEGVAGGRTRGGTRRRALTACLVREPANPVDPDAVRVEVADERVGYLPRADASRYHPLLERLAAAGVPATVRGRLVGGWDRGPGSAGRIGLVLDVAAEPVERRPDCPFLPAEHEVALALGPPAVEVAGPVIATLVEPEAAGAAGLIGVRVGGQVVGHLDVATSLQYHGLVRRVTAAGFPPSCAARVDVDGRRLLLALPDPHHVAA